MTLPQNLAREQQICMEWIEELTGKPALNNEDEAYAVMRAVLQTLRDRLPPSEAAHFSAQMPAVIRGVYFEGWSPDKELRKFNLDEFYDEVRRRLDGACAQVDAPLLTQYVLEILKNRMTRGQLEKTLHALPKDFQQVLANAA